MKVFLSLKKQEDMLRNESMSIARFYTVITILLYKITVFLIAPISILGSYIYYVGGYITFFIIEAMAALLLVFVVFLGNLSHQNKKIIILSIYYMLSIFILITTGTLGAGMVSVLLTTFLWALFIINQKITNYFFIVHTLILSGLTVLLYFGLLDEFLISTLKDTWAYLFVAVLSISFGMRYVFLVYKKAIESSYSESSSRMLYFNDVMCSIGHSIISIDDDTIIYSNNVFETLFGISNNIIGKNFSSLFENVVGDENESLLRLPLDNKLVSGVFSYYHPIYKSTIYVKKEVKTILNNSMQEMGYVVLFEDITKEIENISVLEKSSVFDGLTKLYNRQFFFTELERLDTFRHVPISMIMFEVNGLKIVNDAFGKNIGDQLLIVFANILKEVCRSSDIVSRMDGNSFAILLPNTKKRDAVKILNRIAKVSKDSSVYDIPIAYSYGISSKEEDTFSILETYKQMEDNLYDHKEEKNHEVLEELLEVIKSSLFEKHMSEERHSNLVTIYIEQFSRAMGYSKERRKRLILAAKYHDIGKIAIEERILNSSKGLTPYEYNRMKQHASIGYRILSLIDDYKDIALFVYQHHENYDGKGYPNQLKGKEILEEARMLKIVDAYDSMTNDYSYRKSISKKEAIKELIRCKGKDFDPDLVDVFVSIV